MPFINIDNQIILDTSEYRLFQITEEKKSRKVIDSPAIKKFIFTVSPELSHKESFVEYSLKGFLKIPKVISVLTHHNFRANPVDYDRIPVYQDLKIEHEEIFMTTDKGHFDNVIGLFNDALARQQGIDVSTPSVV